LNKPHAGDLTLLLEKYCKPLDAGGFINKTFILKKAAKAVHFFVERYFRDRGIGQGHITTLTYFSMCQGNKVSVINLEEAQTLIIKTELKNPRNLKFSMIAGVYQVSNTPQQQKIYF
jgi:hypothetical protein